MAAFLTDEWFAALREAGEAWPAHDGASAALQFVIASSPSGKLQFVVRVVDGRLTEITMGKSEPVDCTLQCSYAHATSIVRGELDREVAYMRGDLKIDGDYAAYLLRLQPLFDDDAFIASCQSLRERTEL
jgi:putative sterol carrier protein